MTFKNTQFLHHTLASTTATLPCLHPRLGKGWLLGGVCAGSCTVWHSYWQRNCFPFSSFHSKPEAPCGVPRRAEVLHDREGADSVQVAGVVYSMKMRYYPVCYCQVPADWEQVGVQWHFWQDQIHRRQKDFCGGIWSLWFHTWSFRIWCHNSGCIP